MTLRSGVAALCLGALVLGGCGVATQEEAQPLPSGAFPVVDDTPTPTPTATETEVYFVSGPGLEPVPEALPNQTPRAVLTALAAGPPLERSADLRTLINDPLSGAPMLTVTSVGPAGEVVLARTEAFTLLPAGDQVLLVGQVVSSLADIGRTGVVITDESGVPVPLALPDGRVLEGLATAEDYASLIIPQSSQEPGADESQPDESQPDESQPDDG